jgi:predicted RNase H-like HicB family nuclease
MKFKVVLYEAEEGFTVFCPGLDGCITEGDTLEEALENAQIAIREYIEAAWMETRETMARDLEEDYIISVALADVEVDLAGVEEAQAKEVETVI